LRIRCQRAERHHNNDKITASVARLEFVQRRAARDRLCQALGEFIELVVHSSLFLFFGDLFGETDPVALLAQQCCYS